MILYYQPVMLGMKINQCKDPYQTTSLMASTVTGFVFVAHLECHTRPRHWKASGFHEG